MLRIREFEERVKRTFVEHPGVIRGHTHLADGAEASIVGSIATLGPDDQFFATYRCHGYPLARGTDPKAMMAEIYGRKDGLCKGIGGSMHLADPSTGFLGTSGIVAAGHPARDRRRVGGADPQARAGRPLLLRRRRVEAGRVLRVAEHRVAVEAPDRLRDGEQRLQRPHAHRAGGREPRERRGPLRQGEGIQHAGRDDRRPRPGRRLRDGRRGGRARPFGRGADARRVADVPPVGARQHHRPARRPAALPGARGDREVRRARGVRGGAEGRPGAGVPRPARRRRDALGRGRRRDRGTRARGDAGRGELRPRQPVPGRRVRPRIRLRRRAGGDRFMAHELPFIAAIDEAIRLEMERDDTVLYFGQNMATTENEPYRRRVRQGPRPRHADLGDRRDRDGDRRRDRRLPAGGRALHGRVHARRDGPGDQRGAAVPRDERRPGEGAARAQGRLRVHRRLGGPAHRHDRRRSSWASPG